MFESYKRADSALLPAVVRGQGGVEKAREQAVEFLAALILQPMACPVQEHPFAQIQRIDSIGELVELFAVENVLPPPNAIGCAAPLLRESKQDVGKYELAVFHPITRGAGLLHRKGEVVDAGRMVQHQGAEVETSYVVHFPRISQPAQRLEDRPA